MQNEQKKHGRGPPYNVNRFAIRIYFCPPSPTSIFKQLPHPLDDVSIKLEQDRRLSYGCEAHVKRQDHVTNREITKMASIETLSYDVRRRCSFIGNVIKVERDRICELH